MAETDLTAMPRGRDFWAAFRRNKLGIVGAVLLGGMILMALLAPLIAPYDPRQTVKVSLEDIYAPPGAEHWLGTDDGGKDVLSSFIYGARISMFVGFAASFIAMGVGGLAGLVAGYYGGRIGNLIMRITDILLVIPDLPLMVVLVALIPRKVTVLGTRVEFPVLAIIIAVIGLLGWTSTARLVRSQVLSVKERQFVTRARAVGAGNAHIIRYHIFPAGLSPDAGQHRAGHLYLDPVRVELELSGPGRPHRCDLGRDASLCLQPWSHVGRLLVGPHPTRHWHRHRGFWLHPAGQRAGGDPESAPQGASPVACLPTQEAQPGDCAGRGQAPPRSPRPRGDGGWWKIGKVQRWPR